MTNTRVLKVEVLGDARNVRRAFGEVETNAQRLGRNFQELGRRAAASFVAMGAGAVVIGKNLVDSASDLDEALSRSQVVFGDTADQISAFADTAATAFGQSRRQAIDAATEFAIFGKAAELSGDDLVGFATDFTALASDLASFNNTTPEDAILAIGAAMRGEAEPIRRYGVLLNDAALRSRAMEMGIYDGNGALTAQQKVLAASAEIFAQTTDAQGDFARTADGVANRTRIMSARFENLKATIGQALLPVAVQLLEVVVERILPGIEMLGRRVIPVLVSGFNRLRMVVAPVVKALKDFLAPIVGRLVELAQNNMDTVKAFFAGFGGTVIVSAIVGLATAVGGLVAAFAAIPTAVGGVVALFVTLYNESETFRNVVDTVRSFLVDKAFPAIVTAAKAVKDWFVANWPTIRDAVISAVDAVVRFVQRVWPTVRDIVVSAVRFIADQTARFVRFIRDHWTEIREAISNVAHAIGVLLAGVIQSLRIFFEWFASGWEGFKQIVRGIVDALEGLFDVVVGLLRGDFSQVWDGIKNIVVGAVNVIIGTLRTLKDWFFTALSMSGITRVVQITWDGITNTISGAWATAKYLTGEFLGFFKRLFNLSNLAGFIGDIFGGIAGRISSAFNTAKEALRIAINRIIYMINWLIRKWNGLEFRIPSIIPGIGDLVVGVPDISEIPRLAAGGIVTAPTLALIGEAGPEAVVPLGDSRMGSTYTINVTAGMGVDGPQVGQQIVDAIRNFERASGTSWRAA